MSEQSIDAGLDYPRLASLVEAAEKVTQAALVRDAHQLRARGFSSREAAEVLRASTSLIGRAMQAPAEDVPVVDAQVIEVAEAFLQYAARVASVELPEVRLAPMSDVVVFDIMRDALNFVRGDYAILQRRADDAGDAERVQAMINKTVALGRRVDAVNPRDRDAQLEMTEQLRRLHAQLRQQIDRP